MEKQQIGCTASIFAYKNKLAPGKIKVPISIIFGRGVSNLFSYRLWLPNKMVMYEGQEVPMLQVKGGGYNVLTLKDGNQYTARGEDALIELIKTHFDEIRNSFTSADFEITENKAFAEFDDDNTRTFEVEPDEPFESENKISFIGEDEEE